MKTLLEIFFCADLKILSKCHKEKVQFAKIEILIFVVSLVSAFLLNNVVYGIVVFALYKWFLSNLNIAISDKQYGFLKWLLGTCIALYIALFVSTNNLRALNSLLSLNANRVVEFIVVFVPTVILFYTPIRFKSQSDSLYAKLYKEDLDFRNNQAEDYMREKNDAELDREDMNREIEELSNEKYVEEISNEITQARLRLAKEVLAKWEEEQKKKIESNLEDYIKS
jgi:hypothetical protein